MSECSIVIAIVAWLCILTNLCTDQKIFEKPMSLQHRKSWALQYVLKSSTHLTFVTETEDLDSNLRSFESDTMLTMANNH